MLFSGSPYLLARAVFTLKALASSDWQPVASGRYSPDAKHQCYTVHFYLNVLSSVPNQKIGTVAKMLKAIHAQEDKDAARGKAKQVIEKLQSMKLGKAARTVETGIEDTLTFMSFPAQHWLRIRTNNALEWLKSEIKRRTKEVGIFPDRGSALSSYVQGSGTSRRANGIRNAISTWST